MQPSVFKLELRCFWRQRHEWLNAVLFLCVFVMLYSLAFGTQGAIAAQSSLVIYFGLLFVNQFVVDAHFRGDNWQGCWYQYLTSSTPTWLLIMYKTIGLYLVIGLPLLLAMPILAITLNLDMLATAKIMLFIVLALPSLIGVAMLAASMTVTLTKPSLLFALIAMPLTIPIILLGQSAMLRSDIIGVEYLFISAISVLMFTIIPHIIAFLVTETIE